MCHHLIRCHAHQAVFVFVCRGKLIAETAQPLLEHLQQLVHLNLTGCVIEDSLQCFGSLSRLTSLDLNSAAFDPGRSNNQEVLHIPKLEIPAVCRQRLQDGLASLTSLKRLALPNVDLHPEHLPCLGALHHLQELNIAGCEDVNLRDGPACAELFAGLTNLTALQLSLHAANFPYTSIESEQPALRVSMFQHMSSGLMALAALPLEALRIWQSVFPFKPASYGVALKWRQMAADSLAATFERYIAENGLNFHFPVNVKRAMVQASTLYQEPAAPLEFERTQAQSFMELQL